MNDCQILEVSSDEQSSSLSNVKQTLKNEKLTAPPMPNFERSNVTVVDSTEFDCMMCCCQYGAHGEMASTPPQNNNNSTQICLNSGIWKKCLSSTYLYLYVIFMTFICIFLLIMEVLLDSRALQVTSTASLTTDGTTKHLSAVLHWISFTIICMFLIETILRLAVWKIEVIRNPIALCDSAVIVCSFTVNLTTSLAAGIDSPWDAISLLIIFRFIRIYSLLQGNRREMKTNYSNQIQILQVDLSSVQIANVKLQKQITDKDFEIKQLVAHLGGGSMELDEEIQRVVETSKLRATTTTTSDYETRLQQAIEQSKAEYGNGNGGFVNYSYTEKKDDTTDVIIHHRQNSVKRNLEEKPGTSKQFIDQHHTKDVGTSSSNEQDNWNQLVNNKTSADKWNVGYMINIVDKQPCNQPLPITDAASSSKKLVKINPKQLHKNDKMNEISRWIYKKEDDDDDDSSDEGIESTPSSLKRKIKRFAAETHSISTNVATGDSGTLSDHGFSSVEVDVSGSSPKTINNSFVEKSSTTPTISDNTNNCAIDDIELHEHTSLQQQNNNNNTVSMV